MIHIDPNFLPVFQPFPKIPRLNRQCIVTEKIDGTNASIYISDDKQTIVAGSRNRWLTPATDNFGFAKWVEENREELSRLGPGHHFGEWWGAGIQRRYGLKEKRFSLFSILARNVANVPHCVHVVPLLTIGNDIRQATEEALSLLRSNGSLAAPGFMQPEGVVTFHEASGQLFKVTLEGDEAPKNARTSKA